MHIAIKAQSLWFITRYFIIKNKQMIALRKIREIGFFVLWFAAVPSGAAWAQETAGTISAVVVDEESKEPVGFASAALLSQPSESYVSGMQTVDDGKILFSDVVPGTYLIRVTYIGYENYLTAPVSVEAGQHVSLGDILLKASGELLDEVVVEGTPPPMQLGIDRKIFNVAQSTISVGGNASDLLSNVPSLQVDMDGSVSLRGSSSVRVLINGRESSLGGGDITQLLQALPADMIERVEVVTNPSSKFDAEGQSGIINIVLKEDRKIGLNGSLSASAGSYDNYRAGLNMNYRGDKLNYFGGYHFNRRNSVGDGFNSTRQFSTESITENRSGSNHTGLNHNIRLGADYFLTDKTLIGVSGSVSLRDNQRNEDMFYSYLNHVIDGTSDRTSRQGEDDLGFDVDLDFEHKFEREGEVLSASFDYGNDSEEGSNRFDQVFTDNDRTDDRRINDTREGGKSVRVHIDYVRPLGDDSKFEAGYRTSIRRADEEQRSRYFDVTRDAFVTDYDLTNDFDMDNSVHALYANYQNKITERLGFQVGLRAEQANLKTDYTSFDPNIPEADRNARGKLDYFRVYPSVFLTHEFGDQNQLQLNYTRRVSRPRGWQVNPFVDVSDPMNISQGNPNLLPEDIHAFELSYAKFWEDITLTSSVYFRRVNDVVQPIITEVEGQDGVTFSQWDNISRNESSGMELISSIKFTDDIDVMANANLYYSKFYGSAEHHIDPTDGLNWNANLTANYRIMPWLSAQARGEYRAPRVMAQGKGIEQFVVDAGVRWDVLNRKGSIMFNVRDLLNQRRWGGYTQTDQFYRYYESRWMRRMFMLSFTYRFGQQDFENRRDRQHGGMEGDFDGGY